MRRRIPTWLREPSTLLALGVAGLYLALAFPSAYKVGIAGDETVYMKAAKVYGYYLYESVASLNPFDPDLLHIWSYNREHPPLAKLVSALSWGLTLVLRGGDLPFEVSVFAHRVGPVLLSAALVFLLVRWTGNTHGRWAGAAAGLALVFMPRWFAHSRYAALDGPMAALWLFTGWACWRGVDDRRWAAVAGLVFGLALATKLNAFFLPVAIAAWLALAHRRRLASTIASLTDGRLVQAVREPLGCMVAACALIGPLVFLLAWPWLWIDPVGHLAGYFTKHLTHANLPSWYFGTAHEVAPWHFPFVKIGIATPLTVLGLSLVGLASGLRSEEKARSATILLALLALVPLAVLVFPTPKYGGVRLLLPAFPPLAALAGIGFGSLVHRLASWSPDPALPPAIAAGGLIVLAAPGLHAYATLDPYEDSYYNAAIGGPSGAHEAGFPLVNWGETAPEMIPWLNGRAEQEGSLAVYVPWGTVPTAYYEHGDIGFVTHDLEPRYQMPSWVEPQQPPLSDNVTIVEDRTKADIAVLVNDPATFQQPDLALYEEETPTHEIRREGAPLIQAHDLNDGGS